MKIEVQNANYANSLENFTEFSRLFICSEMKITPVALEAGLSLPPVLLQQDIRNLPVFR
jgi:hypothetical protein